MPQAKAPCGDYVEADSQTQLGVEFSKHQNRCSECQQILAHLREEMFGPNDKDPRD